MSKAEQPGPGRRGNSGSDDIYELREPEPRPTETPRPVLRAARPAVVDEEEDEDLPPPKWPMIQGVFSFPFYFHSLAVWCLLAVGFTLCALGFLLAYVIAMFLLSAGVGFAFSCFLVLMLVASFASASFVTVIEQTAEGTDAVKQWPSGLWRDWFWTLPTTVGLFVPSIVIIDMLRRYVPGQWWLLSVPVLFILYPFMLTSAVLNGSPLEVFSRNVFRSLLSVWWAWVMVFVVSMAMCAAWLAAFLLHFDYHPWVTVACLTPLFPGMMLLYGRMIGRLLFCARSRDDWEI